MSDLVQQYMIQDLSSDELSSYYLYTVNRDKTQSLWVEKVSRRRDEFLLKELKCSYCGEYIHINEYGKCYCDNKHQCYDVVLNNM